MLKRFATLSIATQAVIVLAGILLAAASTLFFWARTNSLQASLTQARANADTADSMRSMVANHGGLYVKRDLDQDIARVGRYLETIVISDPPEGQKPYAMHRKPPFAAVLDLSDQVSKGPSGTKLRITSENPLNRANQADLFETQAIAVLRENKDLKEYWKVEKGQLRFARVLIATQACLSCHGVPSQAPAAVRAQFIPPLGTDVGGGYGWKDGDVVGVTSVTLQQKSTLEMLATQDSAFWLSVATLLGLMLTAFALVYRGLVQPLSRQASYAKELAASSQPEMVQAPSFTATSSSNNELHQSGYALGALHASLSTLSKHLNRQ